MAAETGKRARETTACPAAEESDVVGGALPDLVVIGAMKCGTTALHRYLDAHPDISMASAKELNFFNGPEVAPADPPDLWWRTGRWHLGIAWYAAQFDARARLRGEASPAYTSPRDPEVAARMASVVPRVRVLYLVRDPLDRAVSQYAHHCRDGTETRSLHRALLDPASQYLSRSRYHERLAPFLEQFPREQIHVVVQERLLSRRAEELAAIYRHVGADPGWSGDRHRRLFHVGGSRPSVPESLRRAFTDAVRDDTDRLRALLGDPLAEWDR